VSVELSESESEIRFSAPDIGEAEVEAATRALLSGWITTGEECRSLEAELAGYLGVEHVVALSSCTAALEIAAAHLGLPRGARIGVPTWTFVSSALAPFHRGLRPVPLDIEADTFNLSPAALAAALEDGGLDAVIGVHFGGTPLSDEIHRLCADAGVPLIEDAAHALGARDSRGMVAGQGTAGCCYSFYATKNLTSAEGGALATDDPELAAFAQSFRLHGLSRDAWARYTPGAKTEGYDILGDGLKANLPDVLAAIARAQLERFPGLQARRRELALQYRATLATIPGLRIVPTTLADGGADHLMMVLLPEGVDRTAVQQQLGAAAIGSSVHFRPLHTFAWFAENGLASGPGGTPVADTYVDRALSLPFHTRLSTDDVERVATVLRASLGG
jgi:dTDP-4-amino-4,6-dideoxygalactose transaminase